MLKVAAIKQLTDLKSILNQLEETDYNKVLPILDNGTIGKHTRHILEFYECLFFNNLNDTISYDDRKRNTLLEENIRFASEYIDEIIDKINLIVLNKRILLKSTYYNQEIITESSLYREITYIIEHTVHHLAILRIVATSDLSYITLHKDFGYAESTIQYLNTQKVAV